MTGFGAKYRMKIANPNLDSRAGDLNFRIGKGLFHATLKHLRGFYLKIGLLLLPVNMKRVEMKEVLLLEAISQILNMIHKKVWSLFSFPGTLK